MTFLGGDNSPFLLEKWEARRDQEATTLAIVAAGGPTAHFAQTQFKAFFTTLLSWKVFWSQFYTMNCVRHMEYLQITIQSTWREGREGWRQNGGVEKTGRVVWPCSPSHFPLRTVTSLKWLNKSLITFLLRIGWWGCFTVSGWEPNFLIFWVDSLKIKWELWISRLLSSWHLNVHMSAQSMI